MDFHTFRKLPPMVAQGMAFGFPVYDGGDLGEPRRASYAVAVSAGSVSAPSIGVPAGRRVRRSELPPIIERHAS